MSNGYCGPFVLAYALGVSNRAACAYIRDLTGKRAVFGVPFEIMSEALTGVTAERWLWDSPRVRSVDLPAPERWTETDRAGRVIAAGVRTFRNTRTPETRPTFEQFAREHAGLTTLFVVATRDHYLVLDGFRVQDNNGTGIIGEHYASKRRLTHAWRINRN